MDPLGPIQAIVEQRLLTAVKSTPYQAIQIGDSASFSKTLTEEDLVLFARTSGDLNPVHLDEAYARESRFGERIAHGMWSASLISAAIATELPGPGSIYLNQSLNFRRPVKIGDRLTVRLTVSGKQDEKRHILLDCQVINQDGQRVLDGEARVMAAEGETEVTPPELPAIEVKW